MSLWYRTLQLPTQFFLKSSKIDMVLGDSDLAMLKTETLSKVILYTINSIYPIEITQEILK